MAASVAKRPIAEDEAEERLSFRSFIESRYRGRRGRGNMQPRKEVGSINTCPRAWAADTMLMNE